MSSATDATKDGIRLRVDGMTCGHCVATVKAAILKGLPGAEVDVDLASKLVTVRRAGDVAAVEALIVKAGYTPVAA